MGPRPRALLARRRPRPARAGHRDRSRLPRARRHRRRVSGRAVAELASSPALSVDEETTQAEAFFRMVRAGGAPPTVDRVQPWDRDAPGVVRLPSGRLVRGRALRRALPDGPAPRYALYLLGAAPPPVPWEAGWVRWPDFWLPADPVRAGQALAELYERAAHERVEVACGGGRGRTGTALACLAVLDGLPARDAVAYVRRRYSRRAVETPWQRRFVARFRG